MESEYLLIHREGILRRGIIQEESRYRSDIEKKFEDEREKFRLAVYQEKNDRVSVIDPPLDVSTVSFSARTAYETLSSGSPSRSTSVVAPPIFSDFAHVADLQYDMDRPIPFTRSTQVQWQNVSVSSIRYETPQRRRGQSTIISEGDSLFHVIFDVIERRTLVDQVEAPMNEVTKYEGMEILARHELQADETVAFSKITEEMLLDRMLQVQLLQYRQQQEKKWWETLQDVQAYIEKEEERRNLIVSKESLDRRRLYNSFNGVDRHELSDTEEDIQSVLSKTFCFVKEQITQLETAHRQKLYVEYVQEHNILNHYRRQLLINYKQRILSAHSSECTSLSSSPSRYLSPNIIKQYEDEIDEIMDKEIYDLIRILHQSTMTLYQERYIDNDTSNTVNDEEKSFSEEEIESDSTTTFSRKLEEEEQTFDSPNFKTIILTASIRTIEDEEDTEREKIQDDEINNLIQLLQVAEKKILLMQVEKQTSERITELTASTLEKEQGNTKSSEDASQYLSSILKTENDYIYESTSSRPLLTHTTGDIPPKYEAPYSPTNTTLATETTETNSFERGTESAKDESEIDEHAAAEEEAEAVAADERGAESAKDESEIDEQAVAEWRVEAAAAIAGERGVEIARDESEFDEQAVAEWRIEASAAIAGEHDVEIAKGESEIDEQAAAEFIVEAVAADERGVEIAKDESEFDEAAAEWIVEAVAAAVSVATDGKSGVEAPKENVFSDYSVGMGDAVMGCGPNDTPLSFNIVTDSLCSEDVEFLLASEEDERALIIEDEISRRKKLKKRFNEVKSNGFVGKVPAIVRDDSVRGFASCDAALERWIVRNR